MVVAVTGCGGGSSASSSTAAASSGEAVTSASDSRPPRKSTGDAPSETPPKESAGEAPQNSDGGRSRKKHPPLELPEGKPEQGVSVQQREAVPTAEIELKTPGGSLTSTTSMPVDATCKGRDVSPILEWTGVPHGTRELALFAMNLGPVNGKLYFDWAVAGIDPSLTGLEEGRLPDGAVVGLNGAGEEKYSVCPKGEETIIFALYAVEKPVGAKAGFDPLSLRKDVIASSPSVGLLAMAAK